MCGRVDIRGRRGAFELKRMCVDVGDPTPGARSSASLNNRREVIGAERTSSPSIFNTLVGRPVSIIGESPVTVMVSASVPIFKSTSTLNVIPARMMMPSRRHAEKPDSSAVTAYVPGGRLSNR